MLSIIIPAFNEENTISTILDKVLEVELIDGIKKEIIIVNDCSKDRTEQKVFEYIQQNPHAPLKYYKHDYNKGKGAALHTGIEKASGDYIIVQDADLEYDPQEFNFV